MLHFYLMRHSDAVAGHDRPDYLRELTPIGIQKAKQQGQTLHQQNQISRILHSPYKRAVQTAEIVNDFLNVPMDSCEDLIPNGSVIRAVENLMGADEHFLWVCHLPIVAEIALALTNQALSFYPASFAHIQRKDAFSRTGELLKMHHR